MSTHITFKGSLLYRDAAEAQLALATLKLKCTADDMLALSFDDAFSVDGAVLAVDFNNFSGLETYETGSWTLSEVARWAIDGDVEIRSDGGGPVFAEPRGLPAPAQATPAEANHAAKAVKAKVKPTATAKAVKAKVKPTATAKAKPARAVKAKAKSATKAKPRAASKRAPERKRPARR